MIQRPPSLLCRPRHWRRVQPSTTRGSAERTTELQSHPERLWRPAWVPYTAHRLTRIRARPARPTPLLHAPSATHAYTLSLHDALPISPEPSPTRATSR